MHGVLLCCSAHQAYRGPHPVDPEDFPGGSDGKACAYNVGDPGSIPGLGRISWRRKWQPTPVFLRGKSHGQRSLLGYSEVAKFFLSFYPVDQCIRHLKGPPGVFLLCSSVHQSLKGAPWVGSYSVIQCIRCLMGQPLDCSAVDAGMWRERGYGNGFTHYV